jgi:glyoxylase-like metal-dependent hydrolase (beta-lactamase superfamily II)
MRVHHLNCATLCPLGSRLVYGEGSLLDRARMVCHCLLVETNDGLVLVDTGFGMGDLADPVGHLGRLFLGALAPRLDPEETAVRQVERLGFQAADVRHVVPTHLDLDHAGGLSDFPHATVHIHAAEHAAAMARATFWERERYKPAHWAHHPSWSLYEARGEPWFGFPCVRALEGLPPEILLVPMFGHTRGHCAVAVDAGSRWLVHAGDAYFYREEMRFDRPRCTPALAAFQRVVAMDDAARRANQARLRALARDRSQEVDVFCAHDPVELDRAMRAG